MTSVVLVRRTEDDLFPVGKKGGCNCVLEYILNPILELPKRVLLSFVPPVECVKTYLYIDIIGPVLAIVLLIVLLEYGYAHKTVTQHEISPLGSITVVFLYIICMASFIFATSYIVGAKLKLLEITTMLGYSFYGYAGTLALPFFINSTSEYLFTMFLIIIGGLSTMRFLAILLFSIQVPVARLLICSFVGSAHILLLVYLYYAYMHSTFSFDKRHS